MSQERSSTFERVVGVMVRTFPNTDPTSVTSRTVSSDIAGWDSLSHSLLIMGLEEEFAVELPFEEIANLENVGALVDLVERVARPASAG